MRNSVRTPLVDMRPILLLPGCVNHRAPSGPVAIPDGERTVGYSVMTPVVETRPILSASSVNHSAPSEPTVIPAGKLETVGSGYSVTVPSIAIRPMLFPACSVNHTAPSGPVVSSRGSLYGVGIRNVPCPAARAEGATTISRIADKAIGAVALEAVRTICSSHRPSSGANRGDSELDDDRGNGKPPSKNRPGTRSRLGHPSWCNPTTRRVTERGPRPWRNRPWAPSLTSSRPPANCPTPPRGGAREVEYRIAESEARLIRSRPAVLISRPRTCCITSRCPRRIHRLHHQRCPRSLPEGHRLPVGVIRWATHLLPGLVLRLRDGDEPVLASADGPLELDGVE